MQKKTEVKLMNIWVDRLTSIEFKTLQLHCNFVKDDQNGT